MTNDIGSAGINKLICIVNNQNVMKQDEKLFEQFPPVSTEAWLEKIKTDLKGADFAKKMVWKTNEGFQVMPFYRSENLKDLKHTGSLPGEFPFVRGGKRNNEWFVRQNIETASYKDANKKALDVLMKGVDSLGFSITDPETISAENFKILTNSVFAEIVELNFSSAGRAKEIVQSLMAALKASGTDLNKVKGSVEADPIGRLMVNGKLCVPVKDGLDYLAGLMTESTPMPLFRTVQVNAANFSNAGADIVRELAFGLSLGNEYLSQLTDRGIDIDTAASKTGFTFAIGSNYFMEIAKLRAARLLWSLIVKAYNPQSPEVCRMNILSVTGEWNKTMYDPYVNMLRTQTEAMSATLGGTDALVVEPFDSAFSEPGVFSERIARNQQLLLKEEAHFDKVVDPGAGSYYIENLTSMIADAAWKLFLEVEDRGGFLKALNEGFIQASVETMASKRLADIAGRKEILLGTNQYPNFTEKLSEKTDFARAFKPTAKPDGAEVKPLTIIRGAGEFERLRLASEKSEKRPSVFILATGNPAMRLARAQFSSSFFGCGGYRIIDKGSYGTIADGVTAAIASQAELVVLCSSDEEYATLAPEAFDMLGGKAIMIVAGAPECIDDLKKKGIEHFISIRSNVLDTLKHFHGTLGIKL
jgi:methylmalonyl-CoA mutase